MLNRTDILTANVKFPPGQHTKYKGADKSLAKPGRKQATFPEFYGNCKFTTTFATAHHLSLPVPNQPIPLPITLLTGAACFLPNWAKELSKPVVFVCVYVYTHTHTYIYIYIGKAIPLHVQDPRFQDSRHMKGVSLPALRTGRL